MYCPCHCQFCGYYFLDGTDRAICTFIYVNEFVLSLPDADERNDQDAKISQTSEWSEGETRVLLDKFYDYLSQVGPMKRFKNKKAMWAAIALDIEDETGHFKTAEQCQNRFKTIKKRRSEAKKHNATSGAEPTEIPFDDELAKIKSIDDSFEPELLRGPGRVEYRSEKQNDTVPPKRSKLSIPEMMWKIHEDREKQRERRHKEKVELLKHLLGAPNQPTVAASSWSP